MIVLNRYFPRYNPDRGCWEQAIVPTLLPDSFWISAGLKYDFKANTVTKNHKTYQLPSDSANKLPSNDEWLATEGNYINTEYYLGKENGNPSGNRNVKMRSYFNANGSMMYQIEYEWNSHDQIRKETSNPCPDNDVVVPSGPSTDVYTLKIQDIHNPHVPEGGYWVYEFSGGTFVDVTQIKKEIEQTRAGEDMKLELWGHTTHWVPDGFEMVVNCEMVCNWIPAN